MTQFYYRLLLVLGCCSIGILGCIKKEAPNMEADILAVTIADSLLHGQPIINNSSVALYVKKGAVNLDSFALSFELTPGATISPASGSYQNFRTSVAYTVTSEDGHYHKNYLVTFVEESVPQQFNFENYEFDASKNYTIFYESTPTVNQYIWGSGNAGFSILAGANPTQYSYPSQVTTLPEEVYEGAAALKLVTTSTGALGAMVEIPIAAGSLFIGSLDVSNQFNPQTRMGLPFNKKPARLEGYYNYKPGAQLINKQGNAISGTDECSIYAVLYDRNQLIKNSNVSWLSNNNALTDPSIVAIAELPSGIATSGNTFHQFSIPFIFKNEVSAEDVAGFNYNISIVFSASKNGDLYQGAVGSTLLVDKVTVVTE